MWRASSILADMVLIDFFSELASQQIFTLVFYHFQQLVNKTT